MTRRPLGALGRAAAALRIGPYRRLALAAVLLYMVRAGELSALGWLLAELTSSPSEVAFVGVSRMTPMVLFGLLLGGVVDRTSRRQMALLASTITLCSIGGLLTLILLGIVQPVHVYLSAFFTGVGFTIDFSARRTLLSTLVPARLLNSAVALDSASLTAGFLLGPTIAGASIALAGFGGVYAVLAVLLTAALVMLARVPRDDAPPAGQRRDIGLLAALRSIAGVRVALAVLLITVVMNTFGFPYQFLVPVIAREVLGTGPALYGLLGSATGLGAFLSSFLIGSAPPRYAARLFSIGSVMLLTGIIVFSTTQLYIAALAVLFVSGLGFSGFAVLQIAIVLRTTPPELRGRALGAVALGIGTQPLGILGLGALAERVGAPQAIRIFASIGLTLVILLVVLLRGWRLVADERADAEAAPGSAAGEGPPTAGDAPTGASGPGR